MTKNAHVLLFMFSLKLKTTNGLRIESWASADSALPELFIEFKIKAGISCQELVLILLRWAGKHEKRGVCLLDMEDNSNASSAKT